MTKPNLSKLQRITAFFLSAKKLPLIISLSITVLGAYAQQQKPSYTLLWKISGKGLSRPSYIFGTMHVKDKRVFNFSDSVMLAIQSCPSFALEVHPDTLIKQMFATLHSNDSNSLRKLLSKGEYDELSKRFETKNGYPLGDINPIQAESMMRPVKDKPDDKKTFVDAYLYGVARGLNKNIYGLENTTDQLKSYSDSSEIKSRLQEMLESDEEEDLEETEQMITIYSTGVLKQIYDYLGDEKLADSVLIGRNKVMAKSIIMHMATQPIFSAVGVAHLPGENGLIELLKNEGYTVTPVTANFTNVAAKFNTDYTKLKWVTYTDQQQGYSIDFPFDPVKTPISDNVEAVIYSDMANDMFFGTYATLTGASSRAGAADAAMKRIINNLKSKDGKILSNKIIYVNGLKTTELVVKRNKRSTMRYRFLMANNYLYCIYAGNDLPGISQPYANRFFNSFKSFEPAVIANKNWINYKNDTAAFSIALPMKPIIVKQQIPSPQDPKAKFDLHMYVATDSVKLINYLVRYNDYPAGMYLGDKKAGLEAIAKEIKRKGVKIVKVTTIFKDGYEGREITFEIQGYTCKAQLFLRGNRSYMLLKQNLQGGVINDGVDFFKTFKFEPYQASTLSPFVINDNYRAGVFEKSKVSADSSKTYTSYLHTTKTVFSTNPATGGVFGFEHANINKYYRAQNIDSLFKLVQNDIVSYTDTLLKNDTIYVNGMRGREYITQNKTTQSKARSRVLIDNGNVFYLVSHTADEDLFSNGANMIYNSLVKTSPTPSIDLSASKAPIITTDLLSKDTTTFNYALGALSYYQFDKTELPYLYSALNKSYGNDTAENATKPKLIRAIAKVKDESSVNKLVGVFNAAGTDTKTKVAILNVIANIDKGKGLETYFNLISNIGDIKTDNAYMMFSSMYDSLEYTAANYSRIIPLLKYPHYRSPILSVTISMLSQNKYTALIKSHFKELTAYANDDLENYLINDTTQNKWGYPIYNYLQLMTKIKNEPLTENFTNRLIKRDTYSGFKSEAVLARFANHLPTNQLIINKLLDSLALRYDVLEALNKSGQLAKAPQKYRRPVAFAEASLYKYLTDQDEGNIEHVSLVGTLTEKGSTYYVFKFDTEYDTQKQQRIAICGPYKPGTTKLDFSGYHAYSDWEEKKANWQLQAKKMIPELKKQNAELLKNNTIN
ncbi:TraB/GumN family protein [Mucilaginibacter sp. AK015]|uniref:TraB/GumN family protein n=1 Tax=Mucilaginibacter sp. AK015 TaxID=2723072 RepID=UPI00161DD7BB|nr:TraB/GumN family protein [Mucilaginibacter sp. AK015]MBB5393986.1 uncharacterized protein YbaP (TraB family) [Mucilaginibacter sp. AK015]